MDSIHNNMAFGPSSSSSDPRAAILNQIKEAAAINNARQLIAKLNMHCFDKCIPTPGSSLSKKEETCFTQCMEKYMATWNTVSRQYVSRLQKAQGEGDAGMRAFDV